MTTLQQLQAIKASYRGREDPVRRPFTRPSVLFDPKKAADVDLRTILPIAISGLDVLVGLDSRFGLYRETLFSHASLEVDREQMAPSEEERINKSVSSYLRLLSGFLQMQAAMNTLEYLIRRYRVHVFNMDDLVLCALPYHDTEAFVRILQLLDLGNGKWTFLEGVKSGARPPRKIIVQQCIRDKGILEILCNYASPTKEFHHAREVVCFCTAVVVEALGAVHQLDSDTVKRVLPFVFSGLNPTMKGSRDNKAGALMVAGLVASRASLSPKLLSNLIFFIARMARQDAEDSSDVPWLRMALMTVVNLVQTQSLESIPKKALKCLSEIRDFPIVLKGLLQEFNIDKFFSVYLEALVSNSSYDASSCLALTTIIETIPMKNFIEIIVSKVLAFCVKLSRTMNVPELPEAGSWIKQILIVTGRNYPSELRSTVCKFLQNSKAVCKEGNAIMRTLCLIVDGSFDIPLEISDSKIWFSLEHPEAVVRRAALSDLSSSGLLKVMDVDRQKFINFQDALLRRLYDDDLSVVQAALSIDGLSRVISPPQLLNTFRDVLNRCIDLSNTGTPRIMSKACQTTISCLERIFLDFNLTESSYSRDVASMFFPFLLVLPKTWRVNLKALELAKKLHWPFYSNNFMSYDVAPLAQTANLGHSDITSINQKTIKALAETFTKDPLGHMEWLMKCCSSFKLSRTLLFSIILQAASFQDKDATCLLQLIQACLPTLREEWQNLATEDNSVLNEELVQSVDKISIEFISHLLIANPQAVIANALLCTYWNLLKTLSALAQREASVSKDEWVPLLEDLFIFFATSLPKNAFKEHLQFLARNPSLSAQFFTKFFTTEGFSVAVQVQSLECFAMNCSMYLTMDIGHATVNKSQMQFFLCFPSLLIPLSSENKDVRTATMGCIEELYKFLQHLDVSRMKNGNDLWTTYSISESCFDELLNIIVSQKLLILSDASFLSSLLASLLWLSSSPPLHSAPVFDDTGKRFDQQMKRTFLNFILNSGLTLSSYGKLKILSLFKGFGSSLLEVEKVKSLLSDLSGKRLQHHGGIGKRELSQTEIQILCLLFEVSLVAYEPGSPASDLIAYLIEALKVDETCVENPAFVRPCITILQNLVTPFYDSLQTEVQDELFTHLVLLFHSENGDIRTATREAVMRIKIASSTTIRFLEFVQSQKHDISSSRKMKRNKQSKLQASTFSHDIQSGGRKSISLISSFLDILLLKKDVEKRELLINPLFKLLGNLFSGDWVKGLTGDDETQDAMLPDLPNLLTQHVFHVQQTALHVLQDISASMLPDVPLVDDLFCGSNIKILVECAHTSNDVMTLNNIFMLLSSIAKISSQWVSEYILDLFSIIGDTAARQNDSHSQRALEELISTLVPCWESNASNIKDLLQVFVNVLSFVPENRRLALMVYLLRTLGEKDSLGVLIALLFHTLFSRKIKTIKTSDNMGENFPVSLMQREWEYVFAMQICDQYSYHIWLPSLAVLIQEIGTDAAHEVLYKMYLAMQFVLQKMRSAEFVFAVESGDISDMLQGTLGELLEVVILQAKDIDRKGSEITIHKSVRKQVKESILEVLICVNESMEPSVFFKTIQGLLSCEDENVKKRALRLLCQNTRDDSTVNKKHRIRKKPKRYVGAHPHLDKRTTESLFELSSRIIQLVDEPEYSCPLPVKLAAVSSLELLTKKCPNMNNLSESCLMVVTKNICSDNLALSSSCLRTAAALINVLGSKALSALPCVMKQVFGRSHAVSKCMGRPFPVQASNLNGLASAKASMLSSILIALEAIIENLSSFLSPYLESILDLLVLHPEYAFGPDQKLKLRATLLRKVIAEKIHVRLLLLPLTEIYKKALGCGEISIALVFEMFAHVISSMDRPSVGRYHAKIYEQCFVALDLRWQHVETIKNISLVEDNVIHAIVLLSMKLTESMFRPLFIRSIEWADSESEANSSIGDVLHRKISFYKLVNKLTDQHRSLFVPYFKYMVEGCVHHLTDGQGIQTRIVGKRRKKAKVADEYGDAKGTLSSKQWHLRALILMALHKCFLYDTGNSKFLDSSNFQALLKPIVSQLVVEPPVSSEQFHDFPTIDAVDESVVCCLGQMAVTVGSDDIWKQLNHEVLMQTRSNKIRARILGLRVIKYLVEHLKEEYLVCLPETIPFLSELLEDLEPPVKSLSREVLRELESLSGESLQQYL